MNARQSHEFYEQSPGPFVKAHVVDIVRSFPPLERTPSQISSSRSAYSRRALTVADVFVKLYRAPNVLLCSGTGEKSPCVH